MKKGLLFFSFFIFSTTFLIFKSVAQDTPDTVYTGVYVTSIHDIDFKQKEYTINLWLWLKYKNKEFDFLQNLDRFLRLVSVSLRPMLLQPNIFF